MTINDGLPKQLDKRRLDGKPRVGAKARINGALGTATAAQKAVDKPPRHAAKGGTQTQRGATIPGGRRSRPRLARFGGHSSDRETEPAKAATQRGCVRMALGAGTGVGK